MHSQWLLWGGLAACCTVALAGLARGRWLQSQTLKKSVVLSIGVHAILAVVAAFVGVARPASWGTAYEGRMTMQVVPVDESADGAAVEQSDAPPSADVLGEAATAAAVQGEPAPPNDAPPDLVPLLPAAETAEAALVDSQATDAAKPPAPTDQDQATATDAGPAVPLLYADRVGGRRAAAAAARGGSLDTERAVEGALGWLAAAQAADGRWSVAQHGGGVERAVQGHDRHGVGAKSDHGVTGLALLAFLGAGHTHRDGPYSDAVARGLRFLLERQKADGSLAGDAEFFAALYCHGMATLAVGEACALTADAALRPALDRAVRHTLAMQHPATGGWRYAAGDRGDTSQLGWQVMVLATARQAGLVGLEPAEARARVFLQSVSSGRAGGLASYRPGERPSVAMTAEALVCRLLLGLPVHDPAVREALDSLAAAPPEAAHPNAYTWYYATLASFHAGGPQWDAWNARLLAALLPLQRRGPGPLAGSWDPDPVWGGHGGRVYSTALSAMTLEVYYRHAPIHERQTPPGRQFASQTPGIRLQ
ncbi:MAG: squalene--hopene cyclase [Planctomycetia bacterium]